MDYGLAQRNLTRQYLQLSASILPNPRKLRLMFFGTTIRYLGGFLSTYDLNGNSVLLHKALELGEMLYVAFDTPNRMPITRWKWES